MFFNFNNKKLITINRSLDFDYHSQRNNRIFPHEVCGPASITMALVQAGYPESIWAKSDEDPADVIAERCLQKDAYNKMYKILGTNESSWKPFNIHSILSWAVNDILKKEVTRFRTNWPLKEILFTIIKGGGAALPGDFVLSDGRELGHIVSLAGFTTYQKDILEVDSNYKIDLDKIQSFIIDDPYGNYLENYKSHCGNNIEFSKEKFNEIFRPNNKLGVKWAHLVLPKK